MSVLESRDPRKVVEVISIKPLTNAGSLRALITVRVGDVTVHECRVVQQIGQTPWVSLPQKEYTNRAGERKFTPVVELTDALKKQVCDEVLRVWERGGS